MSLDDIRDYLSYDPETGVFRWIKSPSGTNRVKPGQIAGHLDRKTGYRRIMFAGRLYLAHRLAWWFVHNNWSAFEIDHHHGVAAGNGIRNLREATSSQNAGNQRPVRGGYSRFKGVTFDKQRQQWVARLKINGRARNIGRFDREEEAARAYDAVAISVFGEFARPNFPPTA